MSEIPIEIDHISGLLVNALLLRAIDLAGEHPNTSVCCRAIQYPESSTNIFPFSPEVILASLP
jgi:hypothetical protein